ncbi:MAG: DUF3052 family protein [Ignavibacteriae bacterium]|nr:DUF3052 family protein [Ignavibacteriota bacterium]MCB9243660.1 DUF3052 family protein [Ignavibacteriales bacterium]
MPAGYSGTPLVKKLGIKEGFKVRFINKPKNYMDLLEEIPPAVKQIKTGKADFVHIFTKSRKELASELKKNMRSIEQDGMIWVSWPKKASKIQTDITEDVIREVALPMGLVDIKVCAVDDIWSGLKLVIRKENRK